MIITAGHKSKEKYNKKGAIKTGRQGGATNSRSKVHLK